MSPTSAAGVCPKRTRDIFLYFSRRGLDLQNAVIAGEIPCLYSFLFTRGCCRLRYSLGLKPLEQPLPNYCVCPYMLPEDPYILPSTTYKQNYILYFLILFLNRSHADSCALTQPMKLPKGRTPLAPITFPHHRWGWGTLYMSPSHVLKTLHIFAL